MAVTLRPWSGPSGVWIRPYTVPACPFQATTKDDVRVVGHRLGAGDTAVVFCHGFAGWHRKPRLVGFQEWLARSFAVYAFDFRGHGQSGGRSSFGSAEHLDIEAVVRHARADGFERVVTFGGSMGGIAVLRHAALIGGIEGVVSVSTPARWDGHESDAVRRMTWLTATPSGRWILQAFGVRVSPGWEWVAAPVDLVEQIAPIPLVLVHGRDDHFFDEENAWLLYRRAGHPKRLLLADRFGHAEDGYSPAFARQIVQILGETALRPAL
jgi:pimeloyl-ACP methyl ester carboxylesterase